MVDVRMVSIDDGVIAVEASYPTFDTVVRALLVHGERGSALIDTFARPIDLDVVREEVERRARPLWVINSHADWDHWWGNAAFPDAPVLASRSTLRRQRREAKRELRRMLQQAPDLFAGVELRPATMSFDVTAELDLGGITIELHPLPGHSHDQIVAWLPEKKLLFAADAAEDPLPLATEGPISGWPETLETWAARARTVVPAHGAISGPELLRGNATYLRGLLSPDGREFPELAGADAFYKRAHRRNLKRGAAEAAVMAETQS